MINKFRNPLFPMCLYLPFQLLKRILISLFFALCSRSQLAFQLRTLFFNAAFPFLLIFGNDFITLFQYQILNIIAFLKFFIHTVTRSLICIDNVPD